MPLGFLLLNQFARHVPMLEAQCVRCGRRWACRTEDLVANHGAFLSMPALRRIAGSGCPRLTMQEDACHLRFPQVDRMFGGRPDEGEATDADRGELPRSSGDRSRVSSSRGTSR